jgi:hypothetical protein
MFHHIVLMRFKRGRAEDGARMVKSFARRMKPISPGCVGLTFGPNTAEKHSAAYNFEGCSQGYTHALYCSFKTARDHDNYQKNELHLTLSKEMAPAIKDVCVLDYTTRG